MSKLFLFVIAVSLSTALGDDKTDKSPAAAKSSDTPLMMSFKGLKWTELPERKGMQFAVLSGDPKTGEYTQIRKVPAGTDNPLHSHSSELKNVIISGVWYTGTACSFGQRFRPRVGCNDASQLGARKRLSPRKRLRVLSGGQGKV
jgi:hypothetical protein